MGRRVRGKMGRPRPILVGLTGSLAAGKSTAIQVFKKAGWNIISADKIVHEIYQKEGAKLSVLRKNCLHSPKALKQLEAKIHPKVRKEIFRRIKTARKPTVVEVPLLFEGGLYRRFDLNLCIQSALKERRRRALKRGMSSELFDFLDSRQWKPSKKAALSDYVIWNRDGQISEYKKRLRDLIRLIELQV